MEDVYHMVFSGKKIGLDCAFLSTLDSFSISIALPFSVVGFCLWFLDAEDDWRKSFNWADCSTTDIRAGYSNLALDVLINYHEYFLGYWLSLILQTEKYVILFHCVPLFIYSNIFGCLLCAWPICQWIEKFKRERIIVSNTVHGYRKIKTGKILIWFGD